MAARHAILAAADARDRTALEAGIADGFVPTFGVMVDGVRKWREAIRPRVINR